jgi:hypothetical protein
MNAAKLLIQLTLNVRVGIQLFEFSLYTKYDTDYCLLDFSRSIHPNFGSKVNILVV